MNFAVLINLNMLGRFPGPGYQVMQTGAAMDDKDLHDIVDLLVIMGVIQW